MSQSPTSPRPTARRLTRTRPRPGNRPGQRTSPFSGSETDLGFASEAGATDEPPLPAAIGKYLVIGRFPDGGQAEVYRVVHPQFHQERVIKLAKQPVGADGRSEIIEDGKILADLDHPNIVRVYELDFHENRPYLVMEYIRGRSLKRLCRGAFPVSSPGRRAGGEGMLPRPKPLTGGESFTATSST